MSQAPTPARLSGTLSRAGAAALDRDSTCSDWLRLARAGRSPGRFHPQSCPEPGPPAPDSSGPSPAARLDSGLTPPPGTPATSTHPIPRVSLARCPSAALVTCDLPDALLLTTNPGPASQDPTRACLGPRPLPEPDSSVTRWARALPASTALGLGRWGLPGGAAGRPRLGQGRATGDRCGAEHRKSLLWALGWGLPRTGQRMDAGTAATLGQGEA